MTEPTRWQDIAPRDAVNLNLTVRLDITAPLNEAGERCPWPWEPQQLSGAPLGQYHCGYCGAMCAAGIPHPDYSPLNHPLIGQRVTVTTARADDQPHMTCTGPVPAGHDVTHTGVLLAATYDGEADLRLDDGTTLHLWPALDITEAP